MNTRYNRLLYIQIEEYNTFVNGDIFYVSNICQTYFRSYFGYLYDYITNFTCLVITILQNKDAMAQMAERWLRNLVVSSSKPPVSGSIFEINFLA